MQVVINQSEKTFQKRTQHQNLIADPFFIQS